MATKATKPLRRARATRKARTKTLPPIKLSDEARDIFRRRQHVGKLHRAWNAERRVGKIGTEAREKLRIAYEQARTDHHNHCAAIVRRIAGTYSRVRQEVSQPDLVTLAIVAWHGGGDDGMAEFAIVLALLDAAGVHPGSQSRLKVSRS